MPNFYFSISCFGKISPIEKRLFWPNKTNPTFLDFGGKNVPKAF
jgi:hypothetical protein